MINGGGINRKSNREIANIVMEQLDVEQSLISKKLNENTYSVNRKIVNSKEYYDKFERIPVNKELQKKLYAEAGRLLDYVDGQEEERMIALSAKTGRLIVDNFTRKGSIKNTGFDKSEVKILDRCRDGILLLHNHSLNGRPSAQDLITYLHEERVKISLILCHDGTVYVILDVALEFEKIFFRYYDEECKRTSDNDLAKRIAMTRLNSLNESLSDKHKLFIVKEL